MIPKTIHRIWISPFGKTEPVAMPPDVTANLQSWNLGERRHVQRIWSLDEIFKLCWSEDFRSVSTAIGACRFPAMQADLARLLILYIHGGFWVDLKLQHCQEFLEGLSSHELVLTEHFVKPDLPDPTGHISNSFIGAAPRHPVIAHALTMATSNVNNRMIAGSIYPITGAPNIMRAVADVRELSGYRLLNHEETWGKLFEIRGGSYNDNGMHWSIRDQKEPHYVD